MSNHTSPRSHTKNLETIDYDKNCEELKNSSKVSVDQDAGDVESQTRSDKGCNSDNLHFLTVNSKPNHQEHLTEKTCQDQVSRAASARNPITGMGLNGDGVGGWKPLKQKCRRGEFLMFFLFRKCKRKNSYI
ncbi:microtubule-associated protein Jupiter-like [Cochliomyia hominivorax]